MLYDEKMVILSKEVFYIYINLGSNRKEYNDKIREMSKKYNKDVKFLKSLRIFYYDYFATSDEKCKHDLIFKSKKKNVNSEIVEKILLVSENERLEYIRNLGITPSTLAQYFKPYISDSSICKSLLDEYRIYYNNFNSKLVEARKSSRLNEAKEFFNIMILSGNFDLKMYIKNYLKGISSEKVKEVKIKINYYINIMRENGLLSDYRDLLEENRKIFYNNNIMKIDLIKSKLINDQIDIIDFYMIMGMDLYYFKKLCDGFWSYSDMALFNKFYYKYGCIDDDIGLSLKCNYTFNNVSISDFEKQIVLNFLNEYNIPLRYFKVALVKYANGELDDYIGKPKILKIDNKK